MTLLEHNLAGRIESILAEESNQMDIDRNDLVMKLWMGLEFQRIFQELLADGVGEEDIKKHLVLTKDMEFSF